MSILSVEINILANLHSLGEFADWEVIDVTLVPMAVDLGRKTYVDGTTTPMLHPIVEYSLFFADYESMALKPLILDEPWGLLQHVEERKFSSDPGFVESTTDC